MASLQLYLPFSTGSSLPNFRFRRTPVQSSRERQALFNRIAPVYDNLNDLLSLGQHRIWKRMSVSWSGAKMGDSVLDLCCGSGDIAFLLSEKVEVNGKVIGLDFSKDQLSVASSRKKLKSKACYMNIEWVEGDALDLPFSNGQFDAIAMGYGLRNVVDKRSRVPILDFNKSANPVTASFQEMMIDNVVVPVASGFGLEEDYRYLKRSIREFLTGEELEKLALDVGFSDARYYEIGGGLMGNLAMKEICRVLKAGSRVSILDFNKSAYPVTSSQPSLQEMMIDIVVVPGASRFGLVDGYKYLKRSIREFLTGDELEKLALDVGFSDARYYEIAGGLMGNLVATR
ncbi:hypothetical protein ACLB2K_042619 [Fragaria x ananassa]